MKLIGQNEIESQKNQIKKVFDLSRAVMITEPI
jgi:hypothetical protein